MAIHGTSYVPPLVIHLMPLAAQPTKPPHTRPMKTDALNRRSRAAEPQPVDDFLVLAQDDRLIFSALLRHGLLDTKTLFEFIKDSERDYTRYQKRLTQLYNGYCAHPDHKKRRPHTCEAINYLTKHKHQFYTFEPHKNSLVYGINARAARDLDDHGMGAAYEFQRSNSFAHDLFLGCFTAAFELKARRFRFREELLEHPNCPEATRAEKSPFYFSYGGEKLYPDDIFGNEYEEGRSRFFALEIDRATESKGGKAANTIEKKVKAYQDILRETSYRRLGLPNITVLFATTRNSNADAILRVIEEQVEPRCQPHFLVQAFSTFDDPWRVPKELLPVMTGWRSTKEQDLDISKKATA
jgi:hypothetical protein